MLRIIAILFGVIFIFDGVAGFLPSLTINGFLFGLFEVGTINNIVSLVTGVLAIMGATSFNSTKLFFKVAGIFYTLIAIIGFWRGGDLYFMHSNTADCIGFISFGVIALYLGFAERLNPVN